MNLNNIKLWTDVVCPVASVSALVVGGAFASIQYVDKTQGDRVKETLIFLDRYTRTPLVSSKINVVEMWQQRTAELDKVVADDTISSEDYNRWVLAVIEQAKAGVDVVVLVSFFDTLEACIQNKICDDGSAAAFFGEDACGLYHQHYAKIEQERKTRRTKLFSAPLETFCSRFVAAQKRT